MLHVTKSKQSFSQLFQSISKLFIVSNIRSIIEQAAQQQGNAVEIFLSEWGTMGKKRPTLRFLLGFLIKAQLFRDVDYVAGELLNGTVNKIFLQMYNYGNLDKLLFSYSLFQKNFQNDRNLDQQHL